MSKFCKLPAAVEGSALGRYIRNLEREVTKKRPPAPTPGDEAFIIFHWHGTDDEYPVGIFTEQLKAQAAVDALNKGGKDYGFEPMPLNQVPV